MSTRRVITIGNQKGGVGKTSTAVTLGHGLALWRKRVLIVDLDPQGQAATFLGLRQESGIFELLVSRRPLADVTRSASVNGYARPGLYLVPGDKRTATAQTVLQVEHGADATRTLADVLAPADFDYIIFDTSPSVGVLQEAALYASDGLIVPVACDYPATEGMAGIMATLKAVNARGGRCQLLCALPTMYDTTRESRETLRQLRDSFGATTAEPIHRAAIMRECAADGCTIWEKQPKSRAGLEYARLVRMVDNA